MTGDVAILILAGGRATRFPGKLEHPIFGVPLLQRVYANASATGLPVYLAGSNAFSPALAHRLNVRMLADRWPGGGPLRALISACASIDRPLVFALAGDEPDVDAPLIESLTAAWQPGDEAVIPQHDAGIEPLVALYSRDAVAREAPQLLAQANASMHALLGRMRARFVRVAGSYFTNVNAPADAVRINGMA